MYAGKIDNLNTRSPRLLEAADKYQLSELKEICEVSLKSGILFSCRCEKSRVKANLHHPLFIIDQESLCDNLAVETCLECLVLADLHNAEELKNAAVKFVVEHSEDFVDQVLADFSFDCSLIFTTRRRLIFSSFFQVDKFKSYPDLMALLFEAMATRLLVLIE